MAVVSASQDFLDGPCLQQLYRFFESTRARLIAQGTSPAYAHVEALRSCERVTQNWTKRVHQLANENHPEDLD